MSRPADETTVEIDCTPRCWCCVLVPLTGVGALMALLVISANSSTMPAPVCTVDTECGAGYICRGSECVRYVAPIVNCSGDRDCRTDEWCQVWTDPTHRSKCTPFALYGEPCEGYVAPGYRQKCHIDMTCEFPPEVENIPDLGGQCGCAGRLNYTECGTACEPVCGQPQPDFCIEVCVAGCQCPSGLTRLSAGSSECVLNCNMEATA